MQELNFARRLLAVIAFVYPLYWLAEFFLHGAPPILYALISGNPLEWLQVSYLHVGASIEGSSRWWAPAAAGVIGLAVLSWRGHPIAGLALASAGHIGLQPVIWSAYQRHSLSGPVLLEAVFYLVLVFVGAWWLAGAAIGSIPRRILFLVIALPAAFLGLWLLFSFVRNFPIPHRVYASHVPVLLAALVSAMRGAAVDKLPSRSAIAAGIAGVALWMSMPSINAGIERFIEGRRRAALMDIPAMNADAPYPALFFQKGVNFTAEGPGGYSSPSAQRMLKELAARGIDSIAIVPYGFVPRSRDSIRFPGGMERDGSIEDLVRLAHHLRIKVMLKPQLWISGVSFPGELDYSDDASRARFFADYARFLEHYARLAARTHADLLCVGVEFAKLARFEDEWRELITLARRHYSGPLTYAATQGSEFESVAFWDALDYIGLNNYYPLPDDLSVGAVVRKVEAVHTKFGKPVIFPEAGFASLEAPHRAPWDETPRRLAPADQARAYEALLQAFYDRPWFYGVYWWKVGTNGYGGVDDPSHTPWGKPAMEVVTRWYSRPRAAGSLIHGSP